MEHQLQIFEHEQFGKIRVIIIDGNPWFVATDVCRALEIGNTSQALKRLDDDEKQIILIPAKGIYSKNTQGGEQNMLVVNEPGFYRLVFASRKKEALELQRWVYHEVLPSIRKTGSYSLPTVETAPVPAAPVEKTRRKLSSTACIYILLLSNGLVKIGHTDKVGNRATVIERETDSTVGKLYCTFRIARDKACSLEKICQKNFSSYRVEGEFFKADFSEVINFLDSLVKVEVERNNKILKIANMMDSSPEKQALLIQAVNFYVGKILP